MKSLADKVRLSYGEDGSAEITLRLLSKPDISDLKAVVEEGKHLVIEVKKHRKKRSLDANSYAWVIISKIADILRTSKDEVYIQMLTRYGQREKQLLSVVTEAVDMIYRATSGHCVTVGTSTLNGKEFTHIAVLIGSSQYDSKQMAILIDGIISEAKELGIETMTPQDLEILKQKWGE